MLLFGEGLNDVDVRVLLVKAGPLFAEGAFAAAQRGETNAALSLADEGRARMMAVALKLRSLDLPADQRRMLDDLRMAIRRQQRATEVREANERAIAIAELIRLRQELLTIVKAATAAAGNGTGSVLAQARAVAGPGGAVLVPIVTRLGAKILIVTAAGTAPGITILDLPEMTTDRLNVLIGGNDKTSGWIDSYRINYLAPAELNRRWPEWLTAVGELGPELWRLFVGKLDTTLKELDLKSGARLVWLPSGTLGILPLGLAEDPASKRRLADDYEVVYAPSIQVLASVQAQIATPAPATLAVVINPTKDLPGTEKEGKLMASYFEMSTARPWRAPRLLRRRCSRRLKEKHTGISPRMDHFHGKTRGNQPC